VLGEVIENSTQAYDQREEAQAKMVLMRDKEDKDKTQLNSELKELIRVIDHDKKLKEFMKIKTQERQEDEELISWRKKKEQEAAEKRRKEKEEHSVEAYESKFREIELITGETDLDKLVDRFIQVRWPSLESLNERMLIEWRGLNRLCLHKPMFSMSAHVCFTPNDH
jgi:hypothetical protein